MEELTIGRLARRTETGVETIRYYERIGLVPEPPRLESGYRHYSDEDIMRLKFIKNAKELGFSLREISELLSLRINPESILARLRDAPKPKSPTLNGRLKFWRT